MQSIIEKALSSDHLLLTEISFAAKRHWNYPAEYMDLWKDELTITSEYIKRTIVYSAKQLDRLIGFYSIVENPADCYSGEIFIQKGFWLEHMFIHPEFHHLGIGRQMIRHMQKIAKNHEIDRLFIFVDPFARGFYDKVGADYRHMSKSSIPGRTIPVYELKIQQGL